MGFDYSMMISLDSVRPTNFVPHTSCLSSYKKSGHQIKCMLFKFSLKLKLFTRIIVFTEKNEEIVPFIH